MNRRRFLHRLSAAGLASCGLSASGLLAVNAGGCGPIEVIPDPNDPGARKIENKIMSVVVGARRSELLRYHLGPALRPWATNSDLTLGRGATKGPADLVLDYDHLVDRALHKLHGPPPEARMLSFRDAEISVQGSEARFSLVSRIIDPTDVLELAESYELWLSPIGWLIVRGRRWPLRQRRGGASYRFDSSEWDRRDDLARAAKARGDLRGWVQALLDGWRFRDAWDAAQTITEATGIVEPEASLRWALRGRVAVELGLGSQGVAAFKEALKRDPAVRLPAVKAADDARVSLGQ